MIPSRGVDWITPSPVVEKVQYPTRRGIVEGDLYRPPSAGPHPGIIVCLGVVPFGVEHPQVPVLGNALARAGFAALLYWSPHMRDYRLDPEDIESLAMAYAWLTDRPDVAAARSGLLGTCVGGSFALMAAASPLIRERVSFVAAYAPFSSMWIFGRDIASATRSERDQHLPWRVDQLTRKVFVHSLTSQLKPAEAEAMSLAFETGAGNLEPGGLSEEGRAVRALMTIPSPEAAEQALHRLPAAMQNRLDVLSPVNYAADLRAPLVILLHDAGDQVIPIGESKRLLTALGRREGLHFTEMHFSHLDPRKGRLPLLHLLREFARFFRAALPLFR